jgi:hypothetical protein
MDGVLMAVGWLWYGELPKLSILELKWCLWVQQPLTLTLFYLWKEQPRANLSHPDFSLAPTQLPTCITDLEATWDLFFHSSFGDIDKDLEAGS